MEKIFHWTNTFKTLGENDDGSVNIRGLASTNSLDRTGDVINHDAWTKSEGLAGFQQNPIILFNHNYNKPIGRATSIEVSKEGLELGAKISKSAGEIKDLIKDGVLGAFSVGFRVKDAEYKEETDGFEIKDAELFEVSVVSVPANQINPDWHKAYEKDINDAWTMGLATGKGWDTKLGQSTIEKVNAHSGVGVSTADFEQTVSTNVERDIQLALVLAPLFREISMSSATQIIPILPDSGYAEFASAQTATGSSPHGNLAQRGDTYGSAYGGIDLTERTLSTKKLISQSYLGNETEEDAILPILPLIRESIVRSHARAVENAVLLGNNADGAFGTGGASFDGLWTLAEADSDVTQSSTAFASDSVTAAELLALRKNMGKYGINASDIFYCVSSTAYFNLLEDAEFQDVNLVGSAATKLNGEIGSVFGSKIIVCDEFPTAAVNMPAAIAVWPRNYVMPRLRGMTIESDYEVANQRRVLVASQRIGFTDMIDGATSKWAYQYKGS
jgi:HK97 family phage prohead protease